MTEHLPRFSESQQEFLLAASVERQVEYPALKGAESGTGLWLVGQGGAGSVGDVDGWGGEGKRSIGEAEGGPAALWVDRPGSLALDCPELSPLLSSISLSSPFRLCCSSVS